MDGISILGVSLGVGVVVYALSLRGTDVPLGGELGEEVLPATPGRSPLERLRHRLARPTGEALGFADEPQPPGATPPAPESFVYVPVLAARGPQWKTRLGGAVGLLAMVTIGAVAIALGAYQLGHVLNKMVEGFLGR